MARPFGSTTKLSTKTLMSEIEKKIGMTFSESFADSYAQALLQDDFYLRLAYEKLILSKCLADAKTVDDEDVAAKTQALQAQTTADLIKTATELLTRINQ